MVASVHMSFERDLTGIVLSTIQFCNRAILGLQSVTVSCVPDMFQCARPCGHSSLETPAGKGGNTRRSLERKQVHPMSRCHEPLSTVMHAIKAKKETLLRSEQWNPERRGSCLRHARNVLLKTIHRQTDTKDPAYMSMGLRRM